MQWTLRRALGQDLDVIVSLERSTPELPHWNPAEYERYIADTTAQRYLLLVVEDAQRGDLAGFAAASLRAADVEVAELESVAVLSSARRYGLGRSLCEGVMEWGRQSGATTLQLEVRSQSAGAIELYRTLGFQSAGRRSRYYADPPDDALLMSRVL